MRSALAAFVSAGYALSAVWDEAVVDHEVYGSVFQHDFDESLCRLERLVPEPLDIDGLEGPHDEPLPSERARPDGAHDPRASTRILRRPSLHSRRFVLG